MAMQKIVSALVVSVIIVAALAAVTGRVLHAQIADESSVQGKLEELLNGQRAIMADLAAIKDELRIIKIRVTQQQ